MYYVRSTGCNEYFVLRNTPRTMDGSDQCSIANNRSQSMCFTFTGQDVHGTSTSKYVVLLLICCIIENGSLYVSR